MSHWRKQALAEIPDLRRVIEAAPSVMSLWIELHLALTAAYEAKPPDEERIRQIYRHALWTLEASPGADARTAVIVAFFEHLPTHPAVRGDIHRWIQPELFLELQPVFKYFLSDGELEAFRVEYRKRRAAWLA